MKKEPYISRVDYATTGGFYWVRFLKGNRRTNTYTHQAQQTFLDTEWGGKRNALAAARIWRDKMVIKLKRHPKPRMHTLKRYRTQARSNTGVVGVSQLDYVKKSGRHITAFSANYSKTIDGVRACRNRAFSYDRHDPASVKAAFKQACAYRQEMEKKHYVGAQKGISSSS